jgi:hypothetical protein
MQALEDQILAGDQLILLEFFGTLVFSSIRLFGLFPGPDKKTRLFSFPFKCSSVLNALTRSSHQIDQNVMHKGAIKPGTFPERTPWGQYEELQ